jgi:predicted small secreted protein
MMKRVLMRCAAALALAGGLFVLAACHTVAGMGQDLTDSAHAVQHAL